MNNKKSSKEMEELALKILADKNATKVAKQLAGSVLAQYNTKKETGKDMEQIASEIMKDKENSYDSETKSLAASVLAQCNKDR